MTVSLFSTGNMICLFSSELSLGERSGIFVWVLPFSVLLPGLGDWTLYTIQTISLARLRSVVQSNGCASWKRSAHHSRVCLTTALGHKAGSKSHRFFSKHKKCNVVQIQKKTHSDFPTKKSWFTRHRVQLWRSLILVPENRIEKESNASKKWTPPCQSLVATKDFNLLFRPFLEKKLLLFVLWEFSDLFCFCSLWF